MTEIITTSVIMAYNLSPDDLKSKSRIHPIPEARRMLAYLLSKRRFKPAQIAKELNRNRSLIGRAVEKMSNEITLYPNVNSKYLKTQRIMIIEIENKIEAIENWLINNPEAEWKLRHDKIKELTDLKEEISTLPIN